MGPDHRCRILRAPRSQARRPDEPVRAKSATPARHSIAKPGCYMGVRSPEGTGLVGNRTPRGRRGKRPSHCRTLRQIRGRSPRQAGRYSSLTRGRTGRTLQGSRRGAFPQSAACHRLRFRPRFEHELLAKRMPDYCRPFSQPDTRRSCGPRSQTNAAVFQPLDIRDLLCSWLRRTGLFLPVFLEADWHVPVRIPRAKIATFGCNTSADLIRIAIPQHISPAGNRSLSR